MSDLHTEYVRLRKARREILGNIKRLREENVGLRASIHTLKEELHALDKTNQ